MECRVVMECRGCCGVYELIWNVGVVMKCRSCYGV